MPPALSPFRIPSLRVSPRCPCDAQLVRIGKLDITLNTGGFYEAITMECINQVCAGHAGPRVRPAAYARVRYTLARRVCRGGRLFATRASVSGAVGVRVHRQGHR